MPNGRKRTRLANQEKRGKAPEQRVSCMSGGWAEVEPRLYKGGVARHRLELG